MRRGMIILRALSIWWVSWGLGRVEASLESGDGNRGLQAQHWPQPPYGHVPNPAGAFRYGDTGGIYGGTRLNTLPAALKGASPAALIAMKNWQGTQKDPWVWNSNESRYEVAEHVAAPGSSLSPRSRGAAAAVISSAGDSAEAVSGEQPVSNIVGSVEIVGEPSNNSVNDDPVNGDEGMSSAATAGIAIGAASGGLVIAGGAGAFFAMTRKSKRVDGDDEDAGTRGAQSDYEEDEFTTEGSDSLDESDKFEVDADISFWSKQADFAAF